MNTAAILMSRGTTVALLLAVGSLAFAAPAAECPLTVDVAAKLGPMKPLHGVNNSPVRYNAKDLPEFRELGIPFVRTHDTGGRYGGMVLIDVPNVFRDFSADPADPKSYSFAFTDAYLKPVVGSGCKLVYRLGVTIENFAAIEAIRVKPPANFAKWARICEGIVRHYNEGWANGFRWNIEHWEIWNEPEGDLEWQGTREQFYELYVTAAKHLKAQFPGIKVGGYGSVGFEARRKKMDEWFQSLVPYFTDFLKYVREHDAPLDFFSWHLYTDDPRDFVDDQAFVREQLDKAGFTTTKTFLDEWNYRHEKGMRRYKNIRSLASALFDGTFFCLMQNTSVDAAMIYDAFPERLWCALFNRYEEPAPPYFAFKAYNALYRLGTQVKVEGTLPKDVHALAASDGRETAVLLVNRSREAVVLRLRGLALDGLSVEALDAVRSLASAPELVEGDKLKLPAESLLLVRAKDDANLVSNPGFERPGVNGAAADWSDIAGCLSCRDGVGVGGSRALVFSNRGDKDVAAYARQTIKVEPGAVYRFSAKVKFGKPTERKYWLRAQLDFEVKDAAGKSVASKYTTLFNQKPGKWHELKLETDALPPTAATATLLCHTMEKARGELVFDDVSVKKVRPSPILAVVTSGYRGTYTGETMRVHAQFRRTAPSDIGEAADVECSLVDSAGRTSVAGCLRKLEGGSASWQFGTAGLSTGLYRARVRVKGRCSGLIHDERTAEVKRVASAPAYKVSFDGRNRCLVNGQPFFPLGMYWWKVDRKLVELYAKGPFNCLMPYCSPTGEDLDICTSNGLKVIYSVKDFYANFRNADVEDVEDERRLIRERAEAHKNHPALLAWYTCDEMGMLSRPSIEAHRKWLEAWDPDHPTWIVQEDAVDGFQQCSDVMGTDPYPVSIRPLGTVLETTRRTVGAVFGEKPVWMVPQAFNWKWYPGAWANPSNRFPTVAEMKSMAWQAIAGGANGLVFYEFRPKPPAPDSLERTWPLVCEAAGEVARYIPVMLSDEEAPAFTHDGGEMFALRAWKKDGKVYVLTVNADEKPAKVTVALTGNGATARAMRVMTDFGPAPEATREGGLAASWKPHEAAMWVIGE